MRVLHFYKTAFPDTMGGTEQVIHQLAVGVRALGIESDVLSLSAQGARQPVDMGGYHAHRARLEFQIASTGFSFSAIKRFAALARRADLIHYHFPWPFMDAVHFLVRSDRPSIVTYHSDIVRQQRLLRLYRPLKRRFLASVDRIVATSPNYLDTSEVLRAHADKVSVIPIGIDKVAYPEADPERLAHWRARLGERFFLFVGVLRYYKGLHKLIEAACAAPYPVVIVGAGPAARELHAQAQRLGAANVRFLGFLPDADKIALLRLCHALILPSHLRSEAFGISLLEGAMHGKPLISCEIGTGTSYINIDGETGIVVPPDDVPALARAMHYLWRHPDRAAVMGARAEARYWQYFTADAMARSYADLYRQLAGPAQ